MINFWQNYRLCAIQISLFPGEYQPGRDNLKIHSQRLHIAAGFFRGKSRPIQNKYIAPGSIETLLFERQTAFRVCAR